MTLFALALFASQAVTPITVKDFTLDWNELATPGKPALHEIFTVHGDEVTYARLPADPLSPAQSGTLKHRDIVHGLVVRLMSAKASKVVKNLELQVSLEVPKPVGKKGKAAFGMGETPPERALWSELRDALRVSLGLIPDAAPTAKPSSVGVATMQQNGDLWLRLYSAEPNMPVAEALKIVKPNDAEYDRYLKHLGGLKPGESKSIPAFD